MKTDKDLVTITETYLIPEGYKPGDIYALGEPILITANGIPVYQDNNHYTETRKITEEEAKSHYQNLKF